MSPMTSWCVNNSTTKLGRIQWDRCSQACGSSSTHLKPDLVWPGLLLANESAQPIVDLDWQSSPNTCHMREHVWSSFSSLDSSAVNEETGSSSPLLPYSFSSFPLEMMVMRMKWWRRWLWLCFSTVQRGMVLPIDSPFFVASLECGRARRRWGATIDGRCYDGGSHSSLTTVVAMQV